MSFSHTPAGPQRAPCAPTKQCAPARCGPGDADTVISSPDDMNRAFPSRAPFPFSPFYNEDPV